jgi:hypothetical protein
MLVDPIFYAKKREEQVPTYKLTEEVRHGATFSELQQAHPDAEKEDLRLRGIRAIDARDGSDTLATINRNGVDDSVRLAQANPRMKQRMVLVLKDRQKVSFIQQIKADLLQKRLEALP